MVSLPPFNLCPSVIWCKSVAKIFTIIVQWSKPSFCFRLFARILFTHTYAIFILKILNYVCGTGYGYNHGSIVLFLKDRDSRVVCGIVVFHAILLPSAFWCLHRFVSFSFLTNFRKTFCDDVNWISVQRSKFIFLSPSQCPESQVRLPRRIPRHLRSSKYLIAKWFRLYHLD